MTTLETMLDSRPNSRISELTGEPIRPSGKPEPTHSYASDLADLFTRAHTEASAPLDSIRAPLEFGFLHDLKPAPNANKEYSEYEDIKPLFYRLLDATPTSIYQSIKKFITKRWLRKTPLQPNPIQDPPKKKATQPDATLEETASNLTTPTPLESTKSAADLVLELYNMGYKTREIKKYAAESGYSINNYSQVLQTVADAIKTGGKYEKKNYNAAISRSLGLEHHIAQAYAEGTSLSEVQAMLSEKAGGMHISKRTYQRIGERLITTRKQAAA